MKHHIPQDSANLYYIVMKHDNEGFDIVTVLEHNQITYDLICAMWTNEYLPGTDWEDNKVALSTYAEELDCGDLVFNPPPGAKTDIRWTVVYRTKPVGILAEDLTNLTNLNTKH